MHPRISPTAFSRIIDLLHPALASRQAGDLDTPKTLYLQVPAVEPRSADAHHLLGCAYRSKSRFDDAIASIGTAQGLLKNIWIN